MERLLKAIAADWQLLQTVRERLPLLIAQARRGGVPGRLISRVTQVPNVADGTRGGRGMFDLLIALAVLIASALISKIRRKVAQRCGTRPGIPKQRHRRGEQLPGLPARTLVRAHSKNGPRLGIGEVQSCVSLADASAGVFPVAFLDGQVRLMMTRADVAVWAVWEAAR